MKNNNLKLNKTKFFLGNTKYHLRLLVLAIPANWKFSELGHMILVFFYFYSCRQNEHVWFHALLFCFIFLWQKRKRYPQKNIYQLETSHTIHNTTTQQRSKALDDKN
jgi:hypothetical protein